MYEHTCCCVGSAGWGGYVDSLSLSSLPFDRQLFPTLTHALSRNSQEQWVWRGESNGEI